MMRAALMALVLLAPAGVSAATVDAARSLVISEAPQGNTYLLGGDLTVAAPILLDLFAAAGTVVISSPLGADAAIAGGTIVVDKAVAGDLRLLGGQVKVLAPVAGDVFAAGGSVEITAPAGYIWAGGADIAITGGSAGAVTAYGTQVRLAGTFLGDVDVTASDGLTLAEGTVIKGVLRYNAPQEALIPASAAIDGGVKYTGSSYLPTTEEAQNFALLAGALFFFIRILAGLIAVGVLAGLFPRFSQAVADEALSRSLIRFLMLTLLGFGIMVATPALIFILLLSFAGAAVAFLILAAYIILLLVAYFFSAVIAGAILARGILKRQRALWRDAVLGMLALSIISLVPVAGWTVFLILFAASAGSIAVLFYRFAFGPDEEEEWSV